MVRFPLVRGSTVSEAVGSCDVYRGVNMCDAETTIGDMGIMWCVCGAELVLHVWLGLGCYRSQALVPARRRWAVRVVAADPAPPTQGNS